MDEQKSNVEFRKARVEEEDGYNHDFGMARDTQFGHSWTTNGPSPDWIWIPKGCMDSNVGYPASAKEVTLEESGLLVFAVSSGWDWVQD